MARFLPLPTRPPSNRRGTTRGRRQSGRAVPATRPIGHGGVGGGRVARGNRGGPIPTEARHGNIPGGDWGRSARISGRHGPIARATTSLWVASASNRTHRISRTRRPRSKQRFVLGPGNPLVTSPVTSGLAKVIIRPDARNANGRRGDPTQRSVGHWRTGVQILGHGLLGPGGRFPSFVNIANRGNSRSRRISTSAHKRLTTAARPRSLTPPTLAMASPPRGANPPPCRRAHVPQDLAGRRGARMISRGWDGPRVGSFTNDDTPVAIAGALTRSRTPQAVGGRLRPTLTPGT